MQQILLPSSLLFWGLLCYQIGVSLFPELETLGTIFPSPSLSLRSLHLLQANALPSHPLSSFLPAPRWHVQNFIHSGNITQTASSLKKKKVFLLAWWDAGTGFHKGRRKEQTTQNYPLTFTHTCYGMCALLCHIRTHADTHTHHDQCHHFKN